MGIGFIQDKLEIKFLILYIAARVTEPLTPEDVLDIILYGSKGEPLKIQYTRPNGDSHTFTAPFEGIIPTTERRAAETQSDSTKAYYDGLMSQTP